MAQPKSRALTAFEPWLLASLAASVSYFFARDNGLPADVLIVWKGAAVACLAAYAAHRATGTDRWLLVTVMAMGSLGDMALEIDMVAGGALFALGHLIAIALFLRNRRERLTSSQSLAALALLMGTPIVAGAVTGADTRWPLAAGYGAIVGAMAASAWISRFPRYRVGIGAVMFVASDLIIFARESGQIPEAASVWLVWPLYYAGQFLIATGVARTPRAAPA